MIDWTMFSVGVFGAILFIVLKNTVWVSVKQAGEEERDNDT